MLFFERVRTIALLCLTVFGCTGNILTLIVVNQRFFRKTASASFISALSIADCIVLCLQSLQIVTKLQPQVTSYDCVVFFLMDVFRLLSVWIICFINIERCSLVFNPCYMPRLTSRTKSRILVLILFIISLLIFSHYSHHMHIEYVFKTNQTVPIRSFCAFKPKFHRLTWECVKSGLTYWFTVPLCIICNLIIIQRLHRASHIERTLNNENLRTNHFVNTNKLDLSSKQRQLTAMLVTSSICFVLTATPSTIHAIYILITRKKTNVQYAIHIFTNILLHFHHASNFLAFIFSCTRFRIELLNLFRRYFYCQIYMKWFKRSIPNTEQNLIYSTKQQKSPMKLLTTKITEKKRNIQSQNHNEIALLEINKYKKPHQQRMQPLI
ncbi:unnamed protein product [Rotaria sp. Silwood1]|nr:unnamed protein product [Rotaria sp. Silwood1]CAF1339850.1 unnamed protein product [Rotaria sp. Silwood1]CAF3508689.1 unnamed protein product [Rotaria sp. Silwood1]CAF3541832.1 unnamed protein product [Rotaria sp. Silwood1]CAF3578118.1 unnamed protein product [Rotaria sp. Silwood1]